MAGRPTEGRRPVGSILFVPKQRPGKGYAMSNLTNEAVEALTQLTEIEQKCCLSMVERLKHLGIAHHASSAVCSLASCEVLPIKR